MKTSMNSTIWHLFCAVLLNSPENYAASLYQLYNDERLVEKLIVNPRSLEQPFYQKYDHCVVSYVPRELPDKRFAICQEHTTDSLQMLLKADYMTALNAGHNIRQCVVCKKYFLVKGGAHALYCEGACPHAPQYEDSATAPFLYDIYILLHIQFYNKMCCCVFRFNGPPVSLQRSAGSLQTV